MSDFFFSRGSRIQDSISLLRPDEDVVLTKVSLQQTQLPEFKNVIVLSEHFFNEIKEHPIPVDLVRDRELIKKACLYRYGR
jgi:hypothetical protein